MDIKGMETEKNKIDTTYNLDFNVTDSIWGTITFHKEIEKEISKIISKEMFTRLRYTTHLGLAQLVYPGATHTRYSHCLGTAYLCEKIADRLEFTLDDRRLFVLAGLLHDVGHPPFSHAFLRGLDSLSQKLDMSCKNDKDWTKLIINKCKLDDVIPVLDGKKFYSCLIDSNVDVDKMDYLTRDSHHIGIPYEVDVDFIINSLQISDEQIYLKESGISSIEGLLFNRKQMYKTVYYHQLVQYFETELSTLVELLINPDIDRSITDQLPEFFQEARKADPDKGLIVENFLQLSEADMWVLMKKIAGNDSLTMSSYAKIILDRDKISSNCSSVDKVKDVFSSEKIDLKVLKNNGTNSENLRDCLDFQFLNAKNNKVS